MTEYISTYITGFGEQIVSRILKDLSGVKILGLYDGLIHFQFFGDFFCLKKLPYLNNVFYVMKSFKGMFVSYRQMVESVCASKQKIPITKGTFRLRFSKGNQFVKVDNNLVKKVEKHILGESKLKIDRVNPTTEIWFIIRTEGIAFCGQLLFKRSLTEKNLQKGELRPEFAYLMCLCAELTRNSVVYDPFCGFGSIPKQLVSHFKPREVLASDIELDKIVDLKGKLQSKNTELKLFVSDVLSMNMINDKSIDVIITDPPWGYFEEIDNIRNFYKNMLKEFLRITKQGSTIVILSARKQEFLDACVDNEVVVDKQINTLVNGKKATVYIIHI